MVDEPETPTGTSHAGDHIPAESDFASVILASFVNRHAAEHTVASLGHGFRHKAHSGNAAAFVITHNRDGSFTLAQSRVLTGSGLAVAAAKLTALILAGLHGVIATLQGTKTAQHAADVRQSHVGRDAQQLADVLDQIGPHAAGVVFVCTDPETEEAVAAVAAERGSHSEQHSRTDFLALLDRLGDGYDWLRSPVAEPTTKATKHRRFRHDK